MGQDNCDVAGGDQESGWDVGYLILDVGGQTALLFAHHLSIKAVGKKAYGDK
jgi:hypothetical protein